MVLIAGRYEGWLLLLLELNSGTDAGQHSVPQHTSEPLLQLQTIVFGRVPSLNWI